MELERTKLLCEMVTPKKQKPRRNQNLSSSCLSSFSLNEASIDLMPPEIIANILSRLHFKTIAQCKCVSRLWCSILSDSTTFPTTTIQLSQLFNFTSDLLLCFKTEIIGSQLLRIYYFEDNLAFKKPLRPLKLLDGSSVARCLPSEVYIAGSCNGFVCYLTSIQDITSAVTETPSIYVFNPLTEERFKLPPLPIPKHHKPYIRRWLCGFSFDDSENKFKFVFIVNICKNGYECSSLKLRYNQVLVHTVGTTGWATKTDIVPFRLFESKEIASSAFVNRSLHWITCISPLKSSACSVIVNRFLHIVSFNLGTQEFDFVPTPESVEFKLKLKQYQLFLLDGNLSILEHSHWDGSTNVWVMNKYSVKDSWVMLFSIQKKMSSPPKPIKLLKTGELLLLRDDRDMIAYHPIKQKSRCISLGWPGKPRENTLEIHPIVGTLISVKATFGVDSETEKTTPMDWKRDR